MRRQMSTMYNQIIYYNGPIVYISIVCTKLHLLTFDGKILSFSELKESSACQMLGLH